MADIAQIGTFLRHAAKRSREGWRVDPLREPGLGSGGLFGITQEPDLKLVRSKMTP